MHFIIYLIIVIYIIIFNYYIVSNYHFYNDSLNEHFRYNGLITESAGQGIGVCSQLCCYSGWPSSIQLKDSNVKLSDIGTKYRTTNYTCNNGFQNSGCVCEQLK
jgi:hypothetical protein